MTIAYVRNMSRPMRERQVLATYNLYKEDPAFQHLRESFNFVPGEGSYNPALVFVGEAPGETEDRQERPFVGASGQKLRNAIEAYLPERMQERVFITNLVKYRPSVSNRDPNSAEIQASLTYLERELSYLAPRYVVTLGRIALQALKPSGRIALDHGQVTSQETTRTSTSALLYPMYHPSAALRSNAVGNMWTQDFRTLALMVADYR